MLSFLVSLLPEVFGYNILCMGREAPHFKETVPFGAILRPHNWDLLEGGRYLDLLERSRFLAPRPLMLSE